MQLTEQRRRMLGFPCRENQPGGGIQNRTASTAESLQVLVTVIV